MNSPAAPSSDPIAALIEAVLTGQADDAQFDELERRLQADAAARDTYASYITLHCDLSERFAVEGDIIGLEAELLREFQSGEFAELRRTLAAESLQRLPRRTAWTRGVSVAVIIAVALIGAFVWNFTSVPSNASLLNVRDLEGSVTILRATESATAQIGDTLRPGDRLRTASDNSRAILEVSDGTIIEVHLDSVVQIPAAGEVRLRLLSGSIEVDAAPQPADRPLILATDHARYVIVGTKFRLYRNEEATRLELNEGEVRLQRQSDGQVVESVDVHAGSVATATNTQPIDVKPMAAAHARLHATLGVTGQDVAVTPTGAQLFLNDQSRGLKMWNMRDETLAAEHRGDAGLSAGLAVTPDGETVVVLNRSGFVQLWRPGDEQVEQYVKLPFTGPNVRSRALSADGLSVAQSSDAGIDVARIDPAARTLTVVAELPNLNGKSGKAWSLAFSSRGDRLAAGFWDGVVRVYDVTSSLAMFECKLADTVLPLALSADGRHVAAFTRKDGLKLIDTSTGEHNTLWTSAGANVICLKFTADDRWLMAGCSDRTARLWSVADGRPLLVIATDHTPRGVAWLPQHRQLVTADGSIKIWECELP